MSGSVGPTPTPLTGAGEIIRKPVAEPTTRTETPPTPAAATPAAPADPVDDTQGVRGSHGRPPIV